MKIEIGRTVFSEIPHKGKMLTFVDLGEENTFYGGGNELESENLGLPSSQHIVSLLHELWKNPKGKYERKMIPRLFFEYTRSIYVPKIPGEDLSDGYFIEHSPDMEDWSLIDRKGLVKKLESGTRQVRSVIFSADEAVAFAPENRARTGLFNIPESFTTKGLINNDYILARYGEEGEEKLREIAKNYKGSHGVHLKLDDKEIVNLCSISSNGAGGITVFGDYIFKGPVDWDGNPIRIPTIGIVKT
ncbi:MAG: hypothetical protein WC796_01810 [Candidatus Pacearchaeota archaeon]|jgi:hypothetical protein